MKSILNLLQHREFRDYALSRKSSGIEKGVVSSWIGYGYISQMNKLFFTSCLLLSGFAVQASEPIVTTIAGTGLPADNGHTGMARNINVGEPFGVQIGPDGALYITEVANHRIRRLDLESGKISTVAGTGKPGYSGDGGLATAATMNEPYEIRFDRAGNIYVVERLNHTVRLVDAKTGAIRTIAGTGQAGFSGDGGPSVKAQLNEPHSIALDESRGHLYIADIQNHRIRRVDLQTNQIETYAGDGGKQRPTAGVSVHGYSIVGPRALFVQNDVLWVALREGHSVWAVDLETDIARHVAGTGKQGFSGDGGPAAEATFNGPKGIALDSSGRWIVVVDTENQAIRRIDLKTGRIDTLAGTGPKGRGYNGDQQSARKTHWGRPHGICVAPDGAVYIGDTENHRVRRVMSISTRL
jgi:DNA-binding beta-propeller fold protein YncE